MEIINYVQALLESKGYSILFWGLFLEFIALPFPGETTMAYAGYLSYRGFFHFGILLLVAFLGTTCGMLISYYIGKMLGIRFVTRYGKWFFLSQKKINLTQRWFNRYGNILIFFGYFIPGVRHLTGYVAGITALPVKQFIWYAYSGAFLWAFVFLGIGKAFGGQWSTLFSLFHKYAFWAIFFVFFILLSLYVYRKYQKRTTPKR